MPRNKADDSGADNYTGTVAGPLFGAHARRTDPGTSHAAAKSVKNIRDSQAKVLEILRTHGPLTDAGIYKHLDGSSPSGARTRRSELVTRGLVADSRLRKRTESGRKTIVWYAVEY